MKKPTFLILAGLALAACAMEPEPDATERCGASEGLIGANYAAISFPTDAPVRAIRPGDAVTQDFRAERLNLVLDRNGIVRRVYCG